MGSTGEQPASELVAGLLDTARASRARTMQEVAGAWQRAGTITRNLILMASSEIASIERPATDLVTQLHMYILVAGPEAATSRSQPPSPLGDGNPRQPSCACCASTSRQPPQSQHRPRADQPSPPPLEPLTCDCISCGPFLAYSGRPRCRASARGYGLAEVRASTAKM